MSDKVAKIVRAFTATVTVGGVVAGIIFWFGILPLIATIFQSIFTGLQFLIIMALMILLIILIAKIVFKVDVV